MRRQTLRNKNRYFVRVWVPTLNDWSPWEQCSVALHQLVQEHGPMIEGKVYQSTKSDTLTRSELPVDKQMTRKTLTANPNPC